MLFNSLEFALFLPLVFILYWFVTQKRIKLQNLFIVVSSYVFYAWWDWRFLLLIMISTVVDYCIGIGFLRVQNQWKRKTLLWASIVFNLTLLGFFKYYNFFIENLEIAFSQFGIEAHTSSLNIILPVGISFYTFQTLSYTIDIYRKKLSPTTDFIAFTAFVSFFPQLVAGPIERAGHLLPQFLQKRQFSYNKAVDGLRQILWGLFKKVVIADKCAEFADLIFENSSTYSGSTLLLGTVFFAFQIYGDFSGYSDIAIGTSRLFGFDLKRNFAYPYFSRNVAEFWRRWHISLSTWFRDYLYIPLGGSRGGVLRKVRNTFAIFMISGFWHGASWKFVIWGMLNALYLLPYLLMNRHRQYIEIVAKGKEYPTIKELLAMTSTFLLISITWIFFRAENLRAAIDYLSGICSSSLFSIPEVRPTNVLAMLVLFVMMEWSGREHQYAIEKIGLANTRVVRWGFYILICFSILLFHGKQQPFIYFQF